MKVYIKFYWNSPYIGAFYSKYYRRLYLQLIPFIPIVFDFGPVRERYAGYDFVSEIKEYDYC